MFSNIQIALLQEDENGDDDNDDDLKKIQTVRILTPSCYR